MNIIYTLQNIKTNAFHSVFGETVLNVLMWLFIIILKILVFTYFTSMVVEVGIDILLSY